MMIDDKKNRETGIFNPEDFFEDDFEVIYEGDLPELRPRDFPTTTRMCFPVSRIWTIPEASTMWRKTALATSTRSGWPPGKPRSSAGWDLWTKSIKRPTPLPRR